MNDWRKKIAALAKAKKVDHDKDLTDNIVDLIVELVDAAYREGYKDGYTSGKVTNQNSVGW